MDWLDRLYGPSLGLSTPAMPRVPILMYHKVGPVRKESLVPHHYVAEGQLAMQLETLQVHGFETVTMTQMADGLDGAPLPPRPIILSFDDAYENFHSLALPILKKYSMGATVFVVSQRVGGTNDWDVVKGDVEERLMSAEQILDAQSQGIEFQAHSRTHAMLPNMDDAGVLDEAKGSKDDLEALLGKPVDFFCYPFGGLNQRIADLVRDAGYRGACTVQKRCNHPKTDRFRYGRLNIRHNTNHFRLLGKLRENLRAL